MSMMKKLLFSLLFLVAAVAAVNAQTQVRGVVLSAEDNEPVVRATVVAKGSSARTMTNHNGEFTLNVPDNVKSLIVSYVGMIPHEVAVGPNIRVLLESATTLDEVVVVAYGQRRKEAITGAVSNIKSDAIEKRPIAVATAALEGQALGVQVNNGYGEPGAEPSIRIRGFNSINGDNSPLYVVNGVPMGGNVGDINPADIASITVLKDASSAALYGNKAANGVILITTKGGRIGEESLNLQVNVNYGVYNRGVKEYERLNPYQYMETYWMARRNGLFTDDQAKAAASQVYTNWSDANSAANGVVRTGIGANYNIFNQSWAELFDANGKLVAGTEILEGYRNDLDWYKGLERLGNRSEYNLNAAGGSSKASYFMSVGYLNEEGFLKHSSGERFTGNAKIDVQPSSWFKTGITLNGSHQIYNQMTADAGNATLYINPFYFARNIAPIYPVHLHDTTTGEFLLDDNGKKQFDGGTNRPQSANRHNIWETMLNKDRVYRTTLDATVYSDFILPYGFTFSLKGNLNNRNTSNKSYDNSIIGDGAGQGRMKDIEYRYKNYMFQQLLNWNYTFNEVHNLDATIGHENFSYNSQYMYLYKVNEKIPNIMELSNFITMSNIDGYQSGYKTEGYLGRVGYNYDQKYFAEFSFRRDGSSRFEKNHRWGNFWSLGGSWSISREKFMKDIDWINNMKLRVAYGEVGQDTGVGYYGSMELYFSDTNGGDGAFYKSQYGAPSISWEKAKSMSAAVETRLFGRMNLTVEYYNKTSADLLFDIALPSSIGALDVSLINPVITRNFGSVSNRGFEIGVDVDVIRNTDLTWNIGMNLNTLQNKILKLPTEYGGTGLISGTKRYLEGHGIYDFWLYQFVGIDRSNGRSLYEFNDKDYYIAGQEAEGRTLVASPGVNYTVIDGVVYSNKTTYAKKDWSGSSIPDVYGSFNTSVRYKNFELSALVTYQLGGKAIDYTYQSLMSVIATPSAIHKDALKSWTPDQAGTGIDPNGIPLLNSSQSSDNNATSNRFLISTDYLNIKNISLSYTLPRTLTDKIKFNSVMVSASVDNLFLFTKRQGMNPQQSWNGIMNNGYVPARIFSLGLNVKF